MLCMNVVKPCTFSSLHKSSMASSMLMSTDAINSVLEIMSIRKIGYIIKHILKVTSSHVNNNEWSATAVYIVRLRSFLEL